MIRALVAAISAASLLAVAPASADAADEAGALVTKLNAVRALQGLRPLVARGDLSALAASWSRHMFDADAISHNVGLAGDGPAGWQRLGENVGRGGDVQRLHDAFVASPTHYRNMVDPGFGLVGVGVVRRGDGTRFVTVLFMEERPAAQPAVALPPAPATQPAGRSAVLALPAAVSAAPSVRGVANGLVPPARAARGLGCTGRPCEPNTWSSRFEGWLHDLFSGPGWLGRLLAPSGA